MNFRLVDFFGGRLDVIWSRDRIRSRAFDCPITTGTFFVALMGTGSSQLVRQWLMLKKLCVSSEGKSIADLADELEVNAKTIRRDLATLHDAGFPIEETTGPSDRKPYRITNGSQVPELSFTYDVHPYCITRHRDTLHLLGFKPEDNAFRTWKVNRIGAAQVDSMPFTRRVDFDAEHFLAGSLGIYHDTGDVGVWSSESVVSRGIKMNDNKPNIRIPVDRTNPGQFFACCGLLELAGRLDENAQGCFQGQHLWLYTSATDVLDRFFSCRVDSIPRFKRSISRRTSNPTLMSRRTITVGESSRSGLRNHSISCWTGGPTKRRKSKN